MQTTEGLNLLNSLKHHNNGLALKSKWARSSFWDKSRNIHPGRCCRLCWSAGNYTRPNTKRVVCSKSWTSNLKPWSSNGQSKGVLPQWALPLKIPSAFLRVHRSQWWIHFIFLFPKTPLFKGKKQALQTATSFCLLLETRNSVLQREEMICFQVFHEISPRSNTWLRAEFNTDPS